MTKPYQHWNVLPHGTLVEIDEGILTVVGQISMPLTSLPRRMIKDKDALHSQLLQWAAIESLRRILVSHGEPIESNPRQVLRELAESLA